MRLDMNAARKNLAKSTVRPPGRPRQTDNQAKMNMARHILAKARLLFLQKGFPAVSIHDIVTAAEISKPTLYYYFPDKEQLYAAVLLDLIESASAGLKMALDHPADIVARLQGVAESFFDYPSMALPSLVRDLSQTFSQDTAQQILEHYRQGIYEPLQLMFKAGIERGELRPTMNPHLLSEYFLTMLDWLSLRFSLQQGEPLSSQEKAHQLVHLFLNGASAVPKG